MKILFSLIAFTLFMYGSSSYAANGGTLGCQFGDIPVQIDRTQPNAPQVALDKFKLKVVRFEVLPGAQYNYDIHGTVNYEGKEVEVDIVVKDPTRFSEEEGKGREVLEAYLRGQGIQGNIVALADIKMKSGELEDQAKTYCVELASR